MEASGMKERRKEKRIQLYSPPAPEYECVYCEIIIEPNNGEIPLVCGECNYPIRRRKK